MFKVLVICLKLYTVSYLCFAKEPKNILIYASASLRDGVNELLNLYNKDYNSISIKKVYMSTSKLAQQIKNGATPDLFISANEEWMNYLKKNQLIKHNFTRKFIYNSLVVITKNTNEYKQKIKNVRELEKILLNSKTRISLALTNSVPAGIYAKDYLENTSIWEKLKNKIVESPNVRIATQYVARGDLEYGIVYNSDAVANKRVKIIYFLEKKYHKDIIYPITILNEKKETLSLYNFLIKNKNNLIMEKWGFKINND